MSYANQQDLIDRFTLDQLLVVAEDEENAGSLDSAMIDSALDDAVSEVDLYVGTRYSLPLPGTIPERTANLLKRLACDIAFYFLSKDGLGATDEKRTRYDDAVKTLDRIALGKVVLQIDNHDSDDDDAVDQSASTAEITGPDRVFTRDSMKGVL